MSPADHSHIAAPGILFALASALLFGASTPFAKLLLGALDPWMLAGLLYLGSGLGLAALRIGRHVMGRPAAETPLRFADLPWLAGVVLAGGVIGPVLLMIGLAHTSASAGSLLLNLEGLATMAIAWLVFRENVDRRLLLGAFAILAGAVLLSWSGEGSSFGLGWGALAIAGACLAWGIDNNLTRKLSAADPVQIALIKGLVAGSVNLTLSLAQGSALPGLSDRARCRHRRSRRLRFQSGFVCAGSAPSRHGAHRSVFFNGTFRRRGSGHRHVWRSCHTRLDRRGRLDGAWRLSARLRTA